MKKKSTHSPISAPLWIHGLGLVLVILAGILAYAPSFQNGFVYDDVAYVTENPILNLKGKDFWNAVWEKPVHGNFHPLTVISLAIDNSRYHQNPWGFHVTNFILHIINSLLVVFLAFRLTAKAQLSWIAGILFSVHPLHVESVAWISERKDLLYTLFFLTAWILMDLWRFGGKWIYYLFAIIAMALACLSKGMAVVLPLMIWCGWYFKGIPFSRNITTLMKDYKLIPMLPFLGLSVLFGIIAVQIQQKFGFIISLTYTPFEKLLYVCYGIVFYPIKTLFPVALSVLYPYPMGIDTSPGWEHYAALPVLIVAMGLAFWAWKRTLWVPFMILAYFSAISIVLQILPVGGAIVAERYAYVATLPFILGIAWGLETLILKKKIVGYLLTIVIIAVFTIISNQRGKVWKSNLTLFTDLAEKMPRDPLAQYNVGHAYEKSGDFNNAVAWYRKALDRMPTYVDALYNCGSVYGRDLGKADSGIFFLQKALQQDPQRADAVNNLAVFYFNTGDFKQAAQLYQRALQLKPGYMEAWFNLGNAWLNQGKIDSAQYAFEKTIELNPSYSNAWISLGNLANARGDAQQQIVCYKKAASLGHTQAQEWLQKNTTPQ